MILFYSFLLILLFLVTVGLFGANLIEQFVFPYYSTLKNIRIMESEESNTAVIMKVEVMIEGMGESIAKNLFVKTVKGNGSSNSYLVFYHQY